MKEFIEKLIGRLEELKKIEQNRPDDCDEEGYGDAEQIYDDGRSQGRFEQTHKIIQIVNQLAEEYNNDYILVHTQGLDVGIQCAMCTNPMKSDRGCDGGCSVDKEMYKKVLDVIEKHTEREG